ncbi:MAG TPA: AlpA family phage regulatory protein [Gammaproteobacteria bacterium]|nr:AlpA family phage regulatory protein [Gammaproteobacteria bacterium]
MIRLLRLYDVLAATGYAKSTLYALIAQGLWPKPVKINRSSTWPDYESDAVCAAHIASKADEEIRQLVKELEAARTADKEVCQ